MLPPQTQINSSFDNAAQAKKFLNDHRWSSYHDYCGRENFPSLITTNVFAEDSSSTEKNMWEYLRDIEMTDFKTTLE